MIRNFTTAAVLALGLIGNALADDITAETPFVSSTSRAEVKSELAGYQRSGVNPWAIRYDPLAGFHSTRTRMQATAEFLADREAVAALNSEDSGSVYLAAQEQPVPERSFRQAAAARN